MAGRRDGATGGPGSTAHGTPPTRQLGGPTLRTTVVALVALLVLLLLTVVAATAGVRSRVGAVVAELTEQVLPAQVATDELITAYVDQETGYRGFLLSGDPALLAPYAAGREAAERSSAALRDLLGTDAEGRARLAAVLTTADAWRTAVAEPGIAARAAGPLAPDRAATSAQGGKAAFDDLRTQLTALQDHARAGVAARLGSVVAAQRVANTVAATAAAVAVAVALVCGPLLRRRLTRPLDRLGAQTRAVAAGRRETPIAVAGPPDLAARGRDVETMRVGLLQHTEALVEARLDLAVRDARDRLAAEVHDTSIQRLFALGLALQGTARRHPEAEEDLAPLVDETDDVVRELRALIYGLIRTQVSAATLREQVFDLVRDSGRALGFTPSLRIRGPLEDALTDAVAAELLAVLREALSNIARHARASSAAVGLQADDAAILLTVEDDGVGIAPGTPAGHGLVNLTVRAERLGGGAEVGRADGGGTSVSWRVPRPVVVGSPAGDAGADGARPGS